MKKKNNYEDILAQLRKLNINSAITCNSVNNYVVNNYAVNNYTVNNNNLNIVPIIPDVISEIIPEIIPEIVQIPISANETINMDEDTANTKIVINEISGENITSENITSDTDIPEPKYKLYPPSNEQIDIVNTLDTANIMVSAVPGSGKTTTILHIVNKYQSSKILILTFNQRLRLETNLRIDSLGLPRRNNIECHTYHSFCVKHYLSYCFTDYEIRQILNEKMQPKRNFAFDILIIDEAQDMTNLYFELVCKIMKDHLVSAPKICILGDEHQSIFDFNNADSRYISRSDQLYAIFYKNWAHQMTTNNIWATKKLSTTYRLPPPICDFVNNCLLYEKTPRIIPQDVHAELSLFEKPISEKPEYIICNQFNTRTMFNIIMPYIQKYTVNNIFILAPSIKSNKSPIRKLTNKLSAAGINIFIPTDDTKVDADILQNKLVFSTFHQVKGLERDIVFVIGFDNSYVEYYDNNLVRDGTPNPIYVATTRAKKKLILFHQYDKDYLPYLNVDDLPKYADITIIDPLKLKKNNIVDNYPLTVTKLLRHLPSDVIINAANLFSMKILQPSAKPIVICGKTKQIISEKQITIYETTNEINGVAIPAYLEYLKTGKMTISGENISEENISEENISGENISEKNLNTPITSEYILKSANIYLSKMDQFIYRVNQIVDYNWMTLGEIYECASRLIPLISKNAKFEISVSNKEKTHLRGIVDAIDGTFVDEEKIKNSSNNEKVSRYMLSENKNVDKTNNEKNNEKNNEINSGKTTIDQTAEKSPKIIWEFKCVSELKKEHEIQLALYAYITDYKYKYYLMNILDNLILELVIDTPEQKHNIDKMAEYLIDMKKKRTFILSDDEFISRNAEICANVFSAKPIPMPARIIYDDAIIDNFANSVIINDSEYTFE